MDAKAGPRLDQSQHESLSSIGFPDLCDGLDLLLDVMPLRIRSILESLGLLDQLIEIVLDLGRIPEARFPGKTAEMGQDPVTREDIHHVVSRVGRFGEDNRTGIERTLHRISAIRNRAGEIIGLTCRVGRAVYGMVSILRDVIESGQSILLLGRPGVGKTTLLREAARVLADELKKRVIIVDTSNEIGGDGDIPHPGIGRSRRMQVPSPDRQHALMIEAVENHMPEVIVIDEIGTGAEALAARTIAERGVQLIATAHGNTLDNLLQNPTLSDLVGGVQAVTLSDEEARRRRTQKTVLERKAPPTFSVLIEIQEKDRLAVHHNVADMVDELLRGGPLEPEIRIRKEDGTLEIRDASPGPSQGSPMEPGSSAAPSDTSPPRGPAGQKRHRNRRSYRIFPYAVSKARLEQVIQKYRLPAYVTSDLEKADIVLTLKSQERRQPKRLREVQGQGVPLYVLKSNTTTQIENFFRSVFDVEEYFQAAQAALQEAEETITAVFSTGRSVELSPQPSHVRKLQHELSERYGLGSESKGRDPYRRVVIFPL